jgi:hypothetical protein
MEDRPKIAAIVTRYRDRSHAEVIVTKFMRGFPTDDGLIPPRTQLASLYIDQIHEGDIGLSIADEFNVPIYPSIRSALTLGGDRLAVDGVLLIGEHGDYPRSTLGQEMLPRCYFFEQICGVMAESDRVVPVYNDKHFSYRWDYARWMYETAKRMRIPLWAGSALPVCWRNPVWEHALDGPIDEALAIGFHMLERYGYHGLESLQCQVERRRGGESGVRRVRCLAGDEVWESGRRGEWSLELANRALAAIEGGPGELDPSSVDDPHVFLIDYSDGLRGAVLVLGDTGYVTKFAYAQRCGDSIDAVEYHVDAGSTHAVFGYLGLNIENFLICRTPPTPVERTYLTTGILEAAMRSNAAGGEPIDTPDLETIRYDVAGFSPRRPAGARPIGASLKAWDELGSS